MLFTAIQYHIDLFIVYFMYMIVRAWSNSLYYTNTHTPIQVHACIAQQQDSVKPLSEEVLWQIRMYQR